jgi:hypothetical protein
MLGQAKLALCFQIPSQASLHGIVKPHCSFCFANGPALLRNLWKNLGLRLASKRGCVVKKHPQVGLRGSFLQQVQHSRSESTLCFLFFPSVYIRAIRGLKNDPFAARRYKFLGEVFK